MLKTELHKKDNMRILMVEGRIDSNTAEEFKKATEEAMVEDGIMLVIDAKQLTYISSAGLRVLIAAIKKLGKNFIVLNASLAVKKVIEVAEIPNILEHLETQEEECDKYIEAIYNRFKNV